MTTIQFKRLLQPVLIGFMLANLFVLTNGDSHAQDNPDVVSFTQLQTGEILLRGRYAGQTVGFYLPADWELTQNSELYLNFAAFLPDSTGTTNSLRLSAVLEVALNDVTFGSTVLNQSGEQSVIFTIPQTAWAAVDQDGEQALSIKMTTTEECNEELISLAIHPSSFFSLPHRSVTPITDLRRLPYPVLQKSFLPDTALLVLPKQPTVAELQAALTVAAGFGRMASNRLKMTYITAERLDDTLLQSNHLIFVGRSAAFTQLTKVTLPAPVSNDGFTAPADDLEIEADDGVLQLVPSPWNQAKVLLLVSGQSDTGVVKASLALGGGPIRPGKQTNLAIVTAIEPKSHAEPLTLDRTLSELGYKTETRWGPGLSYFDYSFEIPFGQAVNEVAYFDLVFTHAAMFDFEQAGFSVMLNDEFVGSMRFSDRTTSLSTWRLNLPAEAFHTGPNMLLIRANLVPASTCLYNPEGELWFSIRPESILHLPLGPSQETTPKFDLSTYPSPFVPYLNRSAFVVPNDDPSAWLTAAQLAYHLGWHTEGTILNLATAYSNDVPNVIRQQRDLLVVGHPSKLPLLNEMQSTMPAAFEAGSDTPNDQNAEIKFRVSKSVPSGYLEVFPAPWNNKRTVLTVLGNSEEGLGWASRALIDSSLRGSLKGNFAYVSGDQIIATQINLQPESATAPTPSPIQVPASTAPATAPGLSLTATGGVGIGVFAVLIVLAVWWRRRKSSSRVSSVSEQANPEAPPADREA